MSLEQRQIALVCEAQSDTQELERTNDLEDAVPAVKLSCQTATAGMTHRLQAHASLPRLGDALAELVGASAGPRQVAVRRRRVWPGETRHRRAQAQNERASETTGLTCEREGPAPLRRRDAQSVDKQYNSVQ